MCASTFRPPCKVKIPIRRASSLPASTGGSHCREAREGPCGMATERLLKPRFNGQLPIQRNQFLLLRTFARKLTCSQADSGVPMRTQSQPQFPHELLSFRRPRHDGGSKLRWQNLNEWPLAKADLFCLQSGRPLFHNRKCPIPFCLSASRSETHCRKRP